MTQRIFRLRTLAEITTSLTRYLPGGKAFAAKLDPNKGMYKLHNGLSPEINRMVDSLAEYVEQYFPDTTTAFLEEWESELGIPDECFTIAGLTPDARRFQILVKLSQLSIQTAEEFETVSAVFGIGATVLGGKDAAVSPVITPDKTARFTIVIQFVAEETFTYTFPLPFGNSTTALLECLFENAKPANCNVRFDAV